MEVKVTGLLKTNEKDMAVEFKKKVKEQRGKLISDKPKKQQLYWIYALILNQRRLVYTTCNLLTYYLRCNQCRKQNSLKNSQGRVDYYLNRGIMKLNQDLDITRMIEIL